MCQMIRCFFFCFFGFIFLKSKGQSHLAKWNIQQLALGIISIAAKLHHLHKMEASSTGEPKGTLQIGNGISSSVFPL